MDECWLDITDFYPRPPGGGRLGIDKLFTLRTVISIHALRVEGDVFTHIKDIKFFISIHALRVEGDV